MLSPALTALRGLVFPPVCESCGALAPAGSPHPVCPTCERSIRRLPAETCPRCARIWPLSGSCPDCEHSPPETDAVLAVFSYTGQVKSLLQAYKFKRRRALRRFFTDALTDAVLPRLSSAGLDAVVPVPPDARHLTDRGFHPAADLAKSVAQKLNLPLERRWLQSRSGRAQTGLSRQERLSNAQDRFVGARAVSQAAGRRVLLVDDVYTTGGTVNACARALKAAGALSVTALCLARGESA